MKSLLLLTVLTAPLFLSACVVEHDVVYRHPGPYYHAPYHRDVVVVDRGPVGAVYYTDRHGRYYWRHHRRVYVTVY